jgi:hypothetical protein
METVGDRYDGDLLDDDPVRGWDRAAVVSRAAWIARDAHASPVAGPDRAVHLVLTLTAAPGDPDSGRLTRR